MHVFAVSISDKNEIIIKTITTTAAVKFFVNSALNTSNHAFFLPQLNKEIYLTFFVYPFVCLFLFFRCDSIFVQLYMRYVHGNLRIRKRVKVNGSKWAGIVDVSRSVSMTLVEFYHQYWLLIIDKRFMSNDSMRNVTFFRTNTNTYHRCRWNHHQQKQQPKSKAKNREKIYWQPLQIT